MAISINLELYQIYFKISIFHELHYSQRSLAILVSLGRCDTRLLDWKKHALLKK